MGFDFLIVLFGLSLVVVVDLDFIIRLVWVCLVFWCFVIVKVSCCGFGGCVVFGLLLCL